MHPKPQTVNLASKPLRALIGCKVLWCCGSSPGVRSQVWSSEVRFRQSAEDELLCLMQGGPKSYKTFRQQGTRIYTRNKSSRVETPTRDAPKFQYPPTHRSESRICLKRKVYSQSPHGVINPQTGNLPTQEASSLASCRIGARCPGL